MPIYKIINSEGGTAIHVWKIEESLAQLKEGLELTENSINRMNGMKSELHQKGFLSVRNLLVHAGYEDVNLRYNEYGKPLLNNGKHISITHSFEFAAILISDREAGVDIEKNREKIVNIQHRFVNTEVDSLSDEDLVKQLTVIWGAKESMYKTYPYGGLSFHDHIGINPFLFADGRSSGRVIFGDWKREYEIKFEFFKEGFTLVYAIEKDR
ncbi:4'-phosphopantetheinyl transferase superfamily protein [Lutimonas zeaxanthinifaciens]|uniref:4'-phosphopantetheinyl transferase superfamily protein n=1 Tax=Lutimonas zeaxanthinifaciens TaxID=3060215 RepID=UPI00265CA014|nr:4'-phosphopantetheinyl transferase superfamily protein [Lutimonas sp. YSD2104]WKK66130.1 4'-phosphopantetheinyl transferase superfamily protein [Lutimonas sp. YSD2104]